MKISLGNITFSLRMELNVTTRKTLIWKPKVCIALICVTLHIRMYHLLNKYYCVAECKAIDAQSKGPMSFRRYPWNNGKTSQGLIETGETQLLFGFGKIINLLGPDF